MPMSAPAGARWGDAPERVALRDGEIHVFAASLEVPPPRLDELARLLAPSELERAARFRLERDRRRYVASRWSLRTILARYIGTPAAEIVFELGPHGKPALHAAQNGAALRFNMSRSHELTLIAVGRDLELGVDVEWIRPFPDALAVAGRMCAASEYEALRSVPAAEVGAAFLGLWTRKEAVVKALGLGLSQPLDAFALPLHPGTAPEPVELAGDRGVARLWALWLPPPQPGYVTALAWAGTPAPLRCWIFGGPQEPPH